MAMLQGLKKPVKVDNTTTAWIIKIEKLCSATKFTDAALYNVYNITKFMLMLKKVQHVCNMYVT